MPKTDLRRVKVYELRGECWLDRGTGHCVGILDPGPEPSNPDQQRETADTAIDDSSRTPVAKLEVRQEPGQGNEGGELLLQSRVLLPNYPVRSTQAQLSSSSPSSSSSSSSSSASSSSPSSSCSSSSSEDEDPSSVSAQPQVDHPPRGDSQDGDQTTELDRQVEPDPRERQSTRHRSRRPRKKKKTTAWPEGGGIYQRQQATLVVWTEPDGTDMALSFATAQGCQEIWSFLCDVQNSLAPLQPNLSSSSSTFDSNQPSQIKGYRHINNHARKDSVNWDDEDPSNNPHKNPGSPHQADQHRLIRMDEEDPNNHSLTISLDLITQQEQQHSDLQDRSSHSPDLNVADPSTSSPKGTINPSLPLLPLQQFTHLPEANLTNLVEIDTMIKWFSRSSIGRERVSTYILKKDYVRKLEQVRLEAEDLESLTDLHLLCTLMHSILMLNDAAIYDYCLQDDIVTIVAGILDYDPEFGHQKASYYHDLSDQTRFKEVVPIRDDSIKAKIHLTYRLQYFKDIILARILDDSTFSIINSMLFFNQVEIVQYLHGNETFMKELFEIFEDPIQAQSDSSPIIGPPLPPSMVSHKPPPSDSDGPLMLDRKIDTILFLQQLCSMAKHLQPPARISFFRSLTQRGVLKVVEFGLSRNALPSSYQPSTNPDQACQSDDDISVIKAAVCEILMMIIDYDTNSVKSYCLAQNQAGGENLLERVIDLLKLDGDLGLKVQLTEALRILLDCTSNNSMNGGGLMSNTTMDMMRRDEDPENERFLQFFYERCVERLAEPILKLPDYHRSTSYQPIKITDAEAATFNHLCDLLNFFVAHHSFRSKYFVLSTNLLKKIGNLINRKSDHKFLQLSGLRLLRGCMNKSDEFYDRSIIKNDLLGNVIELLDFQNLKDNLISSACLEFFENIRLTNPKAILNHLMEREGDRVRKMSEKIDLFKGVINRWEQNNEPPPITLAANSITGGPHDSKGNGSSQAVRNIGTWTRTRTLDAEEETYFNDSDEEEDENVMIASSSRLVRQTSNPPLIPTSQESELEPKETATSTEIESYHQRRSLARTQTQNNGPSLAGQSSGESGGAIPKGKPLVDYADEEEEEEDKLSEGPKTEEEKDDVNGSTAQEPPSIKLGERRKREEEEDDDEMMLLKEGGRRSKREKRISVGMVRSNGLLGIGSSIKIEPIKSAPSSSPTNVTPKITFSLSSKNDKLVGDQRSNGTHGDNT